MTIKNDAVCVRRVDPESMAKSGYHGTLLWTPTMQSLLFSGTFYGGLITIIPSGYLADRFGPKVLLTIAVLEYSILTILSPILANNDFYAFFFSRVIMGFGEGFIHPSIASLAARWFPASERAAVANLYTSGIQLAGTIGGYASASLCSLEFLGGWPLIFYIFGVLGCLWCVVFMIDGSSTPDENMWISDEEKEYILKALPKNSKRISLSSVPWRSLFTSKALIVIYVAQFVFNCNVTIMQSFLPAYFRDILLLDLKSNGFFTVFPFITQLICLPRNLQLRNGGFVGLGLFVNCKTALLALVLLGFYGVCFSCSVTGLYISQISVAPAYTGIIMSISLFFGMIANVLSALAFGVLNPYGSESEWEQIFLILVVLNVFSGVLFTLFGSVDQQEWAVVKPQKNKIFNENLEVTNADESIQN
ncbi:hypothetical protein L596_030119 [Steinernema carpocapsae]|uniref:Major facilitator superfamily (MFS) profile domain-containing protein n=1 Tax=Steinernema carpocapsae TaxID=34508 RepID=A0A4U5LRS4_STECR|nr:hypothetical protein L596_030119 [Steinernema carpocapsae]